MQFQELSLFAWLIFLNSKDDFHYECKDLKNKKNKHN